MDIITLQGGGAAVRGACGCNHRPIAILPPYSAYHVHQPVRVGCAARSHHHGAVCCAFCLFAFNGACVRAVLRVVAMCPRAPAATSTAQQAVRRAMA